MHPLPCTYADGMLRWSATVENLGERGEPDILTQVRHWDLLRALRTVKRTRDLIFKHESELYGHGEFGNRTRDLWRSMRVLTRQTNSPFYYSGNSSSFVNHVTYSYHPRAPTKPSTKDLCMYIMHLKTWINSWLWQYVVLYRVN